ncbi:MAG: hypothetical protein Q7R66_11485 [Undibacterium sp.]|uniref:hypothetical protein n=1 Tax=Undibacterium sp. TaxID=1914977 RepID=UPI00271A8300|nr:hypothetical protein [Undibacterium sp.]MDO8652801.1 hypothetical protein [Undibacterium sp.]
MKAPSRYLTLLVLSVVLAACAERDQSLANKTGQRDEKPWAGAKNAYVAKNWTVGNEESWRAQIRSRGQYQNEYVKTN